MEEGSTAPQQQKTGPEQYTSVRETASVTSVR